MDILSAIFHEEFMPHGVCLLWRPGLLWSSAAADIAIALSYFSIPLALVWFVRKRTDFGYRWILALFAAFIVLCGTTHLLGAIIIWKPLYYLDVAVKIATAIVSVFTAVVIWPLIPKLLAMPSQSQLERANAALKESEERYREIFQSSNAVKLIIDPETLAIIDANDAACRFYGYGREEFLSTTMHGINALSPEDIQKTREAVMAGKREHFFFRHRLASGELRDVESFPCVITLNGRKVIHSIVHDISDRMAVEEALREAEARYRQLSEASFEGIVISIDGKVLDANSAFSRIFGYPPGEIIGKTALDLVAPESYGTVMDHVRRGSEEVYEATGRKKDGTPFPMEMRGRSIQYHGMKARISAMNDITGRKAAEEALRQSEAVFRALFNAITETVFIMDRSGVVLTINETGARRLGKRPDEVAGKNVFQMIPENVARRRMKVIEKVFESGETIRMEDQRGNIWFDQTYYPVKDAAGHATMLAVFAVDVTVRKEAEERLHEAMRELEHANQELREFVYIASHDLQEPLRKVAGFGDRLKKHLGSGLDEKGADYLARMTSAAGRMSQLIEDLLAFSRVTTRAKPFGPVDMTAVLKEVLEDLEVSIGEKGAAVTAGSLPVIDADHTQMRQLLQNLIGNSIKFCPIKEPCRVAVRGAFNDAGRELRGKHYAAGELLLISVEDNGIGFDEKYVDRIFGVFQRLHGRREYKGTGVGLAICKKIVERHNGGIEVRSKPGEGSRFTVILPLRHTMQEGK